MAPDEEPLVAGHTALATGRWDDARAAFEAAIADGETASAHFGLAMALWWTGDNPGSVRHCTRAYALFRRSGDLDGAVQCAVWLAVTYKANFANFTAANGWLRRADRLLERQSVGPLHGLAWVARAYRMPDLEGAHALTTRALDVATAAGDIDLELTTLSQLGLIRVGMGDDRGFELIDESMAAALAGEGSRLDTVVYACCDMLNACELVNDIDRAAHWCRVADDFAATYGCPFLYAECRICYGSVLAATGQWGEADRELGIGLRITAGVDPGLHGRALARLAALRVRQGGLEEAERLLSERPARVEVEAEVVLPVASLLMARGEAAAAVRTIEQRLDLLKGHRSRHAAALDLLVDGYAATGDLHAAAAAAAQLADVVATTGSEGFAAMAATTQGRVAAAFGETARAMAEFDAALALWSRLGRPFEAAVVRFQIARLRASDQPDAAVDNARDALAALDALGARLEADRVAAFLRSLGIVVRRPTATTDNLTTREQEVLRLLGAGLSNPEIATRLFVSRKTVSHHVSSILTKLNLRNRAEAAAYAVRSRERAQTSTSWLP